MKQRCNYKKSINYKNYGARGIKVSKRWDTFQNFLDDMGQSHSKHLDEYGAVNTTLDRIDNNKGYSLKKL